MRITIDTKDDSTDDIRKVISLLQNMIRHSESSGSAPSRDIFEDDSPGLPGASESSPAPSEGLFNMFGGGDSSSEKYAQEAEESEEAKEEEDEKPSVQIVEF